MDINGVWKGEYMTHWFAFKTGREIAVPFVMKIRSVSDKKIIGVDNGLFEGICQDDPEVSKISFHAEVSGSLKLNHLFFVKQYPRLMIRNASDEVQTYDSLHPEILYKGEFTNNEFSGVWNMNRTFRKIDGTLCELMPMNGSWWMKKI